MASNFPHGVRSYGVPVMGSGVQIPATTGNYFFVHSGTGSNSNAGTDSELPVATIDYAVGLCTASKGDVIIVMPGHAENISAGTSLVVDVAGVQIIGLGHGFNRPVLTFTNTAGSIEMDAANTRLSNVILKASVSAVVVGINVDADNVTLDNLRFTIDETGDDFITMVDIDAFDGASVLNCQFQAEAIAGSAEAIRLDDCHDVLIQGNHFTGNFSDSAIVGEGALGLRLELIGNFIYNDDTGTANGIDLNVAFTGLIAYNAIATLDAAAVANLLDPGSCGNVENYGVNAIDEIAIVIGGTAST